MADRNLFDTARQTLADLWPALGPRRIRAVVGP